MTIPNIIRSWILLVPLIPSIFVSVFVLYHLLSNRALRKGLNNHVIILLLSSGLIEEITDVSWYVHFYRTGTLLSSTNEFCYTWVLFSAIMFSSIGIQMSWASIERHIIIFYPNLLSTMIKRCLFHYLPMAICILWPTIFYLIMLLILPCNTAFNYNQRLCGRYTCVTNTPGIPLFDSIAHYILPAFVTVFFSVALLARVLYSRYRIRGRIDWRNYKKMACQLLPISALYILLQLPPMTMYGVYSAGLPRTVAASYYSDSIFFNYWVILFTPFASLVSLPDLGTKCRNLFCFWRKRRAVQPATEMTRRNINQTVTALPVVQ